MKPTEKELKDIALNFISHDGLKNLSVNERDCISYGYKAGYTDAISLQPKWVQIEPLLTVIENGLTEHINLLTKINEKLKGDNDFWDYQTAAETNEALIDLRRLLRRSFTTQPPTK